MRYYHIAFFTLLGIASLLPSLMLAQNDTLSHHGQDAQLLNEVLVKERSNVFTDQLPNVKGTYLFTGKRSELIRLAEIDANVAEKTGRQLFARIPGVFVYDMDGTGNQLNIATRGLDPHRSWEMNIRQNGVITNSDMYGYPASHYSAPMESIGQIELVRGTASLQYGAQFGGMINYVTKQADTTRKISLQSINSAGSYGLLSSYNAIGGRVGKWTYYMYHYSRHSKGYRANSRSDASAQFASIQYQGTKNMKLSAEVGRSTYKFQIPGPLTDSMFHTDPRQATRSRNYFNPDIWVPSLRLDWQIAPGTSLSWTTSAVLGARNSLQLDAFANVPDAIVPATGEFKARQVDMDHFKSLTSELRILYHYHLGPIPATVAAGVQIMDNDLHRQQLGKGTTGSNFDLTLTGPFGRDLHFRTKNIAVFVENQFHLTPKLTVSPGLRAERGSTEMTGTISYYKPENIPNNIRHRFVLLGVNAQYQFSPQLKLYGGWSQAYRPVLFKDVIPASALERASQDLKDASGYNAEIGVSGKWNNLHFNVSFFDLLYKNKMGSLIMTENGTDSYILRTNIGDSRNQGIETLIEAQLLQTGRIRVTGFTSTAYIDARYQNTRIAAGTENKSVDGNKVESVPTVTSRNGLTAAYQTFRLTLQYSYVGKTFSDALNTPVPSPNGAKGPVPSYGLWDANASWQISKQVFLRTSVSNLLSKQYFTKRPTFYPGPGIWSSDGRGVVVSLAVTI